MCEALPSSGSGRGDAASLPPAAGSPRGRAVPVQRALRWGRGT